MGSQPGDRLGEEADEGSSVGAFEQP